MTDIEVKKQETLLLREMNLLCCKRLMKPSVEASKRMQQIFFQLHDLTGDKKYLL